MCRLSAVQALRTPKSFYEVGVRPSVRILLGLAVICLGVPRWMGEARFDLPEPGPIAIRATRVALDPDDPKRRRLGALTYLGGVELDANGRQFGGYSAIAVRGTAFTLLSDRGTLLHFRMGADWRPRDARVTLLPAGPGTGWTKDQRDSESLVQDAAGGRAWVGFERWNQIWRYRIAPDGRWIAERGHAPSAMAEWPANGGAESMARMPDGRFVLLSEGKRPAGRERGREALILSGDPTLPATPVTRFTYLPEHGFEPADAAALPDGRLLVLERGYRLSVPLTWRSRLAMVPASAVRAGAVAQGRGVARLEEPLLTENFEGLAIVREGDATILWIVSDDNLARWQRTLLLKFRLDG